MGVLAAGELDRLIKLYHLQTSQNPTNGEVSTAFASTPYACQYAKRVDMKGTKRLIAQQVTSQQQVEYTIRYRDDVSETDRLINEDGIAFEILQIAKLGRREALSLLCRAVMT